MEERRQGDLLIMEKLSLMHTELALNTQATKQTTEQLIKLNGKVVAHESRIQAIEGAQALTATALANMQKIEEDRQNAEKERQKNRAADFNKLKWIVIGLAITLAGNVLLFLIRSDILKQIFTP